VIPKDTNPHHIQLYYDNTAEIAVNTVDEYVKWARVRDPDGKIKVMSMGTSAQNILGVVRIYSISVFLSKLSAIINFLFL
jgi:hypothetical protein